MISELLGAAAIVIAAAFGYVGVRGSNRANQRTATAQTALDAAAKKAEAEISAGDQALELVKIMRGELDSVKEELSDVRDDLATERVWQDEVRDAWTRYDAWAGHVLETLDRVLPDAQNRLPTRPLLPPRPKLLHRRRG
jgi:hypothetical protein